MSLWTYLVSLLDAIVSPLVAWRFDSHEEPSSTCAKRRELIDTIPRGASVLEIGAGVGATLTSGAYEGSAGRFSRLALSEPDRSMRARLSAKLPGRASGVSAGELAVVDAALPALPFPDANFNAVVLFFVASHIEGRPAALAEVARVLAPGGKLLFIDHGVHTHGHAHTHRQRDGEQAVATPARPAPFWTEWFRFRARHAASADLSLDLLLRDFKNEDRLEEVFVSRMQTPGRFYDEVAYGCFVRRPDPDS